MYFVFNKAQIVFWSWEGIGVISPTHINLLVLSLTWLFNVISVHFEYHLFLFVFGWLFVYFMEKMILYIFSVFLSIRIRSMGTFLYVGAAFTIIFNKATNTIFKPNFIASEVYLRNNTYYNSKKVLSMLFDSLGTLPLILFI